MYRICLLIVLLGRADEVPEEGVGPVGLLLNSGWNWTPTNQGVLRQIHNLHQPAVGGQARQAEACGSRVSRYWLLNS